MKKTLMTAAFLTVFTGFSTLSASAANTGQASPSLSGQVYTVVSGDVLWKIAAKYNVSTQDLIKVNGLSNSMIYPNQLLVIPGAPQPVSSAVTYTVQAGDLPWQIAARYNISTQQLMNANSLTSAMIYPGQKLVIPSSGAGTVDKDNSTKVTYTVKSGDLLWKIAADYHVTVKDIMQVNQLTSDWIYPNQQLIIPDQNAPATNEENQPAQEPSSAPADFSDAVFPLAKGTYQPFTDNYATVRTWSESGPTQRSHEGVDILAPEGTPVVSAEDGTVVNIGWSELGGWRLTIRVNDSTAFYYAHFSGYADGMKMGAQVKKGQLIGYVGSTGYGPEGTKGQFESHLHFGIYKTNTPDWTTIDPYSYLKAWADKQF